MTPAPPLLATRALSKSFGGLRAVDGVDLELRAGEILGVIGPNGAGKTTLFSLIAGSIVPTSGEVLMRGFRVSRRPAHKLVRAGVVRTHQIVRPFPNLTVAENVAVGAIHGVWRATGAAARRAPPRSSSSSASRTARGDLPGHPDPRRPEAARAGARARDRARACSCSTR